MGQVLGVRRWSVERMSSNLTWRRSRGPSTTRRRRRSPSFTPSSSRNTWAGNATAWSNGSRSTRRPSVFISTKCDNWACCRSGETHMGLWADDGRIRRHPRRHRGRLRGRGPGSSEPQLEDGSTRQTRPPPQPRSHHRPPQHHRSPTRQDSRSANTEAGARLSPVRERSRLQELRRRPRAVAGPSRRHPDDRRQQVQTPS